MALNLGLFAYTLAEAAWFQLADLQTDGVEPEEYASWIRSTVDLIRTPAERQPAVADDEEPLSRRETIMSWREDAELLGTLEALAADDDEREAVRFRAGLWQTAFATTQLRERDAQHDERIEHAASSRCMERKLRTFLRAAEAGRRRAALIAAIFCTISDENFCGAEKNSQFFGSKRDGKSDTTRRPRHASAPPTL